MRRSLKYNLYRLRYRLGFLTHLDIEINNTCNHKCIMCWHSKPLNFGLKVMSADRAIDYLQEGRMIGFKSVKFNLRGEPTLHRQLPNIVRAAKRFGYVDTMINTHGQHLVQRFDELQEAGLDTIIVSIGNTDPKGYAKLHQVPERAYYELHEGLRHAHKVMKTTMIKLNCHFSKTSNFNFDMIKNHYPKFKIVKRYIMEREGSNISLDRNLKRKAMCPHMKRRLTVLVNGDIYPCCMAFNEPKSINLGKDFKKALKERKQLIRDYRNNIYRTDCVKCPSGDVWKAA